MDVIKHFLQLPDTGFGVFGVDVEGRLIPDASESSKQLLNHSLSPGEAWSIPQGIDPVVGGIVAVDKKWVELRPMHGPDDTILWATKDITPLVEAENRLQNLRWLMALASKRQQALDFVEHELTQLARLPHASPLTARARMARLEAQASKYGMTSVVEACVGALDDEGVLVNEQKLRQSLEDILLLNRELSEDGDLSLPSEDHPVDIDLVQSTFRLMGERLSGHVELVVSGSPQSGHGPFHSMILPLLENALIHGFGPQHNQREPTVWLHFWMDDTHWRMSVKDNGSGLALEALQRRALDAGRLTAEGLTNLQPHEYLALAFITPTLPLEKGSLQCIRSDLAAIGGGIELRTEPGLSTTVSLSLPRAVPTSGEPNVGASSCCSPSAVHP